MIKNYAYDSERLNSIASNRRIQKSIYVIGISIVLNGFVPSGNYFSDQLEHLKIT